MYIGRMEEISSERLTGISTRNSWSSVMDDHIGLKPIQ